MNEKIEKTLKALESNNMKALYVETKQQAKEQIEKLLFEGCTISSGGSMSLVESGIIKLIRDPKYNYLDRNRSGITEEEKLQVFKDIIGCDFYFCSANALTENGELINVDGFSNRVSAIAFGPKRVIAVVGINKLVKDAAEGFLRVKRIAAPKNCVRLGIDNPCAKLGHCISLEKSENPDITDGCRLPSRICCDYLVSAMQREKDRITVIICGESLGF